MRGGHESYACEKSGADEGEIEEEDRAASLAQLLAVCAPEIRARIATEVQSTDIMHEIYGRRPKINAYQI